MSKVRIGLVGCGLVALSVHLKNLPRLVSSELVALADPDPNRRERARQLAPQAKIFEDYHDLLALPTIDAVIVSVPYEEHAKATIAAINAGKHVYLEKPFATNLADAQRIVECWQGSDRVVMVGFNYRFHPLYQALKQAIQANQIGNPNSTRSTFCFVPQTGIDWQITRHGSFGAIFDIAPHHIDLVRFLLETDVAEVFMQARSPYSKNDTVLLQLRMVNDVLVQSFFCLHAVEVGQVEIYGTDGKLAVDHYRSLAVEFTTPKIGRFARAKQGLSHLLQPITQSHYLLEKLRSPWHEPSFLRSITHFVNTVRHQQPVFPNVWDGYCNQQVIDAAQESAQTGKIVVLSGIPDILTQS
ncbi:MAG: Gfo/Idh/MocA family oxidoreductase [Cyanobacteria bacterium]|nr:Gfo/Idh/MocA family oxidoreductase [Cyanobacteriota bacterium]MDW8201028.1 Gfo/Idh/MocA family oxidoreductase [Cyanobacteriota bacterium SKYGB_h_bin112]